MAQTTPRRSKRHQPTVFANTSSQRRDDKWSLPPLHTRDTVSTDLIDDDESTDDSSMTFYTRFSRASRAAASETFSVGDTALLATHVKRPSVGIIIALWEVRKPVTDSQKKLAKVHWFLRPIELAQLRAKRAHLPVRPPFFLPEPRTYFPLVCRTRSTSPSTRRPSSTPPPSSLTAP